MGAGARRAGRRLCRRLDDLVHLFILVPAFRAVEEGARRGPRAEIAPAAGCSSCSLPVFGRRGPREQARRDLPHRPLARGGAGALPPEHRPQPSRARRRPAPRQLQPLERLQPRRPRCGRAHRTGAASECFTFHQGSSGCSTSAKRLSLFIPVQHVRNQCA